MSLSAEDIGEYLDRIAVPQHVREWLREGPDSPYALKAITKLQHCHLAAVPFENLDLLYSSHHSLPSDTESVYERVVKQRRGGVCDQVHMLFTKLLKSFGFVVYCTGSRINAAAGLLADPQMNKSKPSFGPW
jgi:arylamine N-acetyltransferase